MVGYGNYVTAAISTGLMSGQRTQHQITVLRVTRVVNIPADQLLPESPVPPCLRVVSVAVTGRTPRSKTAARRLDKPVLAPPGIRSRSS